MSRSPTKLRTCEMRSIAPGTTTRPLGEEVALGERNATWRAKRVRNRRTSQLITGRFAIIVGVDQTHADLFCFYYLEAEWAAR